MFSRILVANRGEIACRIMRTARRLGIRTVAVYSDADADSLHVRMADDAVHIGPAPARESYLNVDAIVRAARDTDSEAVHPGFGFLSENAAFARRLEDEGITFIGPDARAIAAMGDKIESRRLAARAGVNVIPGHDGVVTDVEEARAIAREIGYPVMLKASAGGGGKGMRVARSEEELAAGLSSARNEARSSFGDDRVFIERFIQQPRHIEIQILADGHGGIVHLGERECSIQRRHQKVIEEAPSPFVDEAMRRAMGEQAVALARAVKYRSAGTVEFVVDAERNFYFLEMNTRLQVEHPVTEFVTGLDLVEWMIRIADGERLGFTQDEVSIDGWAVEARVYAEDPERGFLPSTGRLFRYRPPLDDAHLRIDTGVFEGAEISMYYDPMIAKLVTYGEDRSEAIARLRDALDAYCIRGVAHNLPFLAAVAGHPRFLEGRLSTGFIDEAYPDGFSSFAVPHPEPDLLLAAAALMQWRCDARDRRISGQLDGAPPVPERYVAFLEGDGGAVGEGTEVRLHDSPGVLLVEIGTRQYEIASDWRPGQPVFHAHAGPEPVCMQVERRGLLWRLTHRGHGCKVRLLSPRAAAVHRWMPVRRPPDHSRLLLSPMPGLLVHVAVAEGDAVTAGQELAVVEAMKMENVLRAERDGVVAAVRVQPGSSVAADEAILEFE